MFLFFSSFSSSFSFMRCELLNRRSRLTTLNCGIITNRFLKSDVKKLFWSRRSRRSFNQLCVAFKSRRRWGCVALCVFWPYVLFWKRERETNICFQRILFPSHNTKKRVVKAFKLSKPLPRTKSVSSFTFSSLRKVSWWEWRSSSNSSPDLKSHDVRQKYASSIPFAMGVRIRKSSTKLFTFILLFPWFLLRCCSRAVGFLCKIHDIRRK